jgi:ArsR family transcriptional regulator
MATRELILKRERTRQRVPGLLHQHDRDIFDFSNMSASDLFGAFANPIRLRILNLLHEQKEICVCDLCEVLDVLQPKVSRHLAILRDARLVEVRSDGKWKFYALAQASTPLHRTLLRCIRSCLGEIEELAADRERLAGIEARLRCA